MSSPETARVIRNKCLFFPKSSPDPTLKHFQNLHALSSLGQPVKRTVGQVTKPVDFHFCTDNRIKQHGESQPENEYKEVDFAAVLRKHPSSPVRTNIASSQLTDSSHHHLSPFSTCCWQPS